MKLVADKRELGTKKGGRGGGTVKELSDKFIVYLLFIFIIIDFSFSSLATWGPACLSGYG